MRIGPDDITISEVEAPICPRCRQPMNFELWATIGRYPVLIGRYCKTEAMERRAELLAAEDD